MKRYLKEMIILLIQLFMFYIFPLFAGPTDAMGMVFLIWISTIVLGLLVILLSTKKIKYLYPLVISVLFIPSVFIYYNESALIHAVWYLVISCIGMIVGVIINFISSKLSVKE